MFYRLSCLLPWCCYCCCLIVACQPAPPQNDQSHPVKHRNNSFYYWQSTWQLSPQSEQWLAKQAVQHLYLKLFDVAWSDEQQTALPIAKLVFQDDVPTHLQLVPTVFITNEAILQTPMADIPTLAKQIGQKIQQTINDKHWNVKQLQIDCDWTANSQDRYFALLQQIKQQAHAQQQQLSATIRLHQVKYAQQTGIPPVDRGMLMVYNTNDVRDIRTQNSILDPQTVVRYTNQLKQYPLPLDVALPIFSWAVLFRNSDFKQIINQIPIGDFEQQSDLFLPLSNNRFKVRKNTHWKGIYLLKNDVLRIDQSLPKDLLATAQHLAAQSSTDSLSVVFFHFDPKVLQQFGETQLTAIWQTWRTNIAEQ